MKKKRTTSTHKPKATTTRKKVGTRRKKATHTRAKTSKTSIARKARMKKTIATLKNGLKALEKEVNK